MSAELTPHHHPHPPTIAEQIDVIECTIADLRESFECRDDDDESEITDPEIVHLVKCLQATRFLLMRSLPVEE